MSGGGDSLALLRIASDWARDHGRRLRVLTVDHGLSPDSSGWTDFARDAVRAVGADWRALSWTGPKPATGLPAAARAARHRLIADAAREAGARVVLFAHTADDIAEGEVMRGEGSTLGRLREWAPSPAWPEGRGLMLLRPMLDARRREIRDWLYGRGESWIDDPANEDPRFGRSRARRSLLPWGGGGSLREQTTLTLSRQDDGFAAVRSSRLPMGEGCFEIDRDIAPHALAAALVCAGGGDRPPRGDRLQRIVDRLHQGDRFTAVLCGARIAADGPHALITREAGEFRRRPRPPLPLPPGVETVWDGRWALTVAEPGWSVAPAAGLMARLSKADRARLDALPAAARGAWPVLIRNAPGAAVLAREGAGAACLVETRLALALDTTPHEGALV
ncbi:MAG: tRNA lysidine(34) synthetase TilS [Brevundimonas sp.]|nr:MAG: tRNA lysidine(34) synthetase TilS [Brevundimonas sp.]